MVRVQFVQIYPNVLRYGSIGSFRLRPDRCNECLRQHGCGWFESVKGLLNVLVWNLRGSLFYENLTSRISLRRVLFLDCRSQENKR